MDKITNFIIPSKVHGTSSYSKLGLYNGCNRRFKYQYIMKIKPPFSSNIWFEKGKFIHSLLEDNISEEKVKIHNPNTAHCDHKDVMKWSMIYHKFIRSSEFLEIDELVKRSKIVEVEKDVSLFINDLDSKLKELIKESGAYYKDGKYYTGKTDLFIYDEENKTIYFIDWKTGKFKELSVEQLVIYALIIGEKMFNYDPEIKIVLRYVFVDENKRHEIIYNSFSDIFNDEEVLKILNRIKNDTLAIDDLTRTDYLRTENRSKCKNCYFEEMCKKDEIEEIKNLSSKTE